MTETRTCPRCGETDIFDHAWLRHFCKQPTAEAEPVNEVIALENEIMAALPGADAAAELDASLKSLVASAHDILCNGWSDRTITRLERMREIAAEIRRFV